MEKIRLQDGPRHGEMVDEVPEGYTLIDDASNGTLGRVATWTESLDEFERIARDAGYLPSDS